MDKGKFICILYFLKIFFNEAIKEVIFIFSSCSFPLLINKNAENLF